MSLDARFCFITLSFVCVDVLSGKRLSFKTARFSKTLLVPTLLCKQTHV